MAQPASQDELRERPLADLLRELSQQTTTLVRQELELARAELTEKSRRAGLGAGLLSGAGVAALLALGSLSACLIVLLDTAMATSLAALIVAVGEGLIAAALALVARKRVREATPAAPKHTIETLKEDVQWAKTQRPSVSR